MPLHPQSDHFIQLLQETDPPPWQELAPNQGRAAFSQLTELFGSGPACAVVDDAEIAGVPCRRYSPSEPCKRTIVYFHGGGWVLGDLESHDAVCRRLTQRCRCEVVAVDYSRSPEARFPTAIEQGLAVVRALQESETLDGVEGHRELIVAGDSAGGNLAIAVAMRLRDSGDAIPSSQVLIYPVVTPDFTTQSYQSFATDHGLTKATMKWFWEQYLGPVDLTQPEKLPYASILHTNLDRLPRTLVITAEYDVLRDEGRTLAKALEAHGNEVEQVEYAGLLHGFFHFAAFFDDAATALEDIGKFLDAK